MANFAAAIRAIGTRFLPAPGIVGDYIPAGRNASARAPRRAAVTLEARINGTVTLPELVSTAQRAGYELFRKAGGVLVLLRGGTRLTAKTRRDGSVEISGIGGYVALSELFPDQ